MEAVFKARSFLFLSVIMLVSGGAFAFFGIRGLITGGEEVFYPVFMIVLGLCLAAISAFYLAYNKGASLKISDGHVKAVYGIKKTADIPFSDIEKVTLGCDLVDIYRKSGGKVRVTGLLNALSVYVFLSEKVFGDVFPDSGEDTGTMLVGLGKLKKKNLVLGVLIAVPVLIIALAVVFGIFFSGKLPEETKRTLLWVWVAAMPAAFVGTYILCRAFQKCGIDVQKKELEIRRAVFGVTPFPPGNVVCAYRDGDFTMRITVYGYPNSQNVYCTLEEIDETWALKEKLRSPAFSRMEKLRERFGDFDDMIKIKTEG